MILIAAFLTYNILLLLMVFLPAGKIINHKSIVSLKSETDSFRWNKRLAFIILAVATVAGMRESFVGTDYHSYLDFYNNILDYGSFPNYSLGREIGWNYLNLWFGKLGVPSGIFFGFVAGLTWYFFIKGSYKFQFLLPLMFFFFMVHYFFWTMSGLRQSIAIVIFFYSIKFIIERNPIYYISSILIASLFHLSVLIMLPIYLLSKIKFNRKLFFILYVLSIFFIGNEWFLNQMSQLIVFISSKVEVLSSYLFYLDSDSFTAQEKRTSSGLGIILTIITVFFILYKSEEVLKKQPKLTIYFVLFFIAVILNNIFLSVEVIGRALTYLMICFPIVMASTVYYSTKKYERMVVILLIIAYFMIFNVQIYRIFSYGENL
ncbi:EpsG family protein [Sulfurovum sp. CS9]|uniref:EpsG family protein n=1 Tax=Sulfurovum sp. CS9 TaxID=3391146 RepID=UPI0039EC648B